MKVFILTTELNSKNGWGRYSLDLIHALTQEHIGVVVAMDKNGYNEMEVPVRNILPDYRNYNKNYFMALWYAWRLRAYTKDCDVIHSFVEPYSYIAYWLSKLTGKKYFITTHGSYGVMPFRLSALKRYFHKKSFASAEKVICVSEYTKKRLAAHGLTNLHVINNGINFERFHSAPIPVFQERENIVLSVGALKFRKGCHISLQAFARVADKYKDIKYYIVGDQGDSNYFAYLEKLATDLKIAHRVEFFSSLSDDDLLALYRRAKVFVLSSISKSTHFEGFGLVYLEANACGTPVVGTRDSGAEDAIMDGKTGFLVPQNDSTAIAHAMSILLEDPILWHHMSGNGVAWAREHAWHAIIKKYEKTYSL